MAPRKTVTPNLLHSVHDLSSGPKRAFGEQGIAADGTPTPILNPLQPIASHRGISGRDFDDPMEIDVSFINEDVKQKRPKYLRDLEAALAFRSRVLLYKASVFAATRGDAEASMLNWGHAYNRGSPRFRSIGLDFVRTQTAYDVTSIETAATEQLRSDFHLELTAFAHMRRQCVPSGFSTTMRGECQSFDEMSATYSTAVDVYRAAKSVEIAMDAGHTPDLGTITRLTQTPQSSADIARILCQTAFYLVTDPARIFLDYVRFTTLWRAIEYLGRVNLGRPLPSKEQAAAFLEHFTPEKSDANRSEKYRRTHAHYIEELSRLCIWGKHRGVLTELCRAVLLDALFSDAEQRTQLWPMR